MGLNLSEELFINSFRDPRAAAFGFKVGDRIIQVNGYPVSKQTDFLQVKQEAVRQNTFYSLPIIIDVMSSGTPPLGELPLDMQGDICGKWSYGTGPQAADYAYTISKVGGQLIFQQWLPSGEKVTGMLLPHGANSPWIGSRLTKSDGTSFGEIRLHYDRDEEALVSQLKKEFDTQWSGELTARKVSEKPDQGREAWEAPPAPGPQNLPVFAQSQAGSAFSSETLRATAAPPPPPTMAVSQASASRIPQTTLPSAPASSLPAVSVSNLVGAPEVWTESNVPEASLTPAPTLPAMGPPPLPAPAEIPPEGLTSLVPASGSPPS